MNFKSIQWRLQLWYGLILVIMLAGLGITAYELEQNRVMRQVDEALHDRLKILTRTLNGPPPRPADAPENDFGPDGDFGPPSPPPPRPYPGSFHLPPRDEALFGGDNLNGFYYVILDHNGREIARSTNAVKSDFPKKEDIIVTPTNERILAGHFISPELAELHRAAIMLAAVGGTVLVLGLSVGWLLVARALRPIADISAAAEKISTGDLTQRIDVDETESELGRLAVVLNSTFARLESAFAMQKRFAADAAHELRTPVSVLIAQTQAALNRKRSYEENLQTIEACNRASQRMRRLIAALLQIARLDAGQETGKRVSFDLQPVAGECVELVKPLAEARGLRMVLEAAPTPVRGDAEQIHQVISNLVTNAIQYNKPGGEVRVGVHSENGNAVVTVIDNGMGISGQDLPHVFERFYRADKSRSSGNIGLGLAITKAIVEAHGGTIEVSSQENAGANFTVRLPGSTHTAQN